MVLLPANNRIWERGKRCIASGGADLVKKSLPVTSTKEPGLLVHITDRAQISTKDFEVCVLSDIVFGHLKHAQMEVGDWTERATCDENYRDLFWIAKDCG